MTDTATPPPSQPQMVMPPIQYGIGLVPGPGGKQQLVLQFQTIYGLQAYPFDPNNAIDLANALKKAARRATSGLEIVEHPKPAGVVDLSQFQPDEDDEIEGDEVGA